MIEKRTFGRTNLSVSVLGFGGAPIGYLKTDIDRVSNVLNLLLDSGVNVIDTAANYPGSEEVIGQTIAHRRSQFILTSKCGTEFSDLQGKEWSATLITHTIDRSLKRLRTDHLDVMLLHSCSLQVLQRGEAIEALVAAKKAGKIRHPGYSGDNEAAVYAAARPELDVIQTSINIADERNIDVVLPATRKNIIGVMAKRPIADAAWKPRTHRPGLYADYGQVYEDRLKKMNLDPARFGLTWPELALRFTLSIPGVHTAIVGTTNPDHVSENLRLAEKGPLPGDVIEPVRAAFHNADLTAVWNGQT